MVHPDTETEIRWLRQHLSEIVHLAASACLLPPEQAMGYLSHIDALARAGLSGESAFTLLPQKGVEGG